MRHPLNPGFRVMTRFSSSHPGTDFAPPTPGQTGVPCHAPERSTVIASGYNSALEGEYVILQGHDTGKFYYFGHFARNSRRVSVGQVIAEGTVIATLGMTGKATGIHTHCEVRDARNSAFAGKHDPEIWFKQAKGNEVANEAQVKNLYRLGLFREADAGGLKTYTGKDANYIVSEMLGSKERKNVEAHYNKPPVEVIKEVPKIVYQDSPETQKLVNDLREETKVWSEKFYNLEEDVKGLSELNDELKQAIKIKDKEIKRLEANQVEGSPWERLIQAIKDLLKGVQR